MPSKHGHTFRSIGAHWHVIRCVYFRSTETISVRDLGYEFKIACQTTIGPPSHVARHSLPPLTAPMRLFWEKSAESDGTC